MLIIIFNNNNLNNKKEEKKILILKSVEFSFSRRGVGWKIEKGGKITKRTKKELF